jgi:hypothetical protein
MWDLIKDLLRSTNNGPSILGPLERDFALIQLIVTKLLFLAPDRKFMSNLGYHKFVVQDNERQKSGTNSTAEEQQEILRQCVIQSQKYPLGIMIASDLFLIQCHRKATRQNMRDLYDQLNILDIYNEAVEQLLDEIKFRQEVHNRYLNAVIQAKNPQQEMEYNIITSLKGSTKYKCRIAGLADNTLYVAVTCDAINTQIRYGYPWNSEMGRYTTRIYSTKDAHLHWNNELKRLLQQEPHHNQEIEQRH